MKSREEIEAEIDAMDMKYFGRKLSPDMPRGEVSLEDLTQAAIEAALKSAEAMDHER